jgi:hypothetical protein
MNLVYAILAAVTLAAAYAAYKNKAQIVAKFSATVATVKSKFTK